MNSTPTRVKNTATIAITVRPVRVRSSNRRHGSYLTAALALFSLTPLLLPLHAEARAAVSPGGDTKLRLAAQNKLFREQVQSDDQAEGNSTHLRNFSVTAVRKQHATDVGFYKRLTSISTRGFPEADFISHQVLLEELQQRLTDYGLKIYEMPLTQRGGVHTEIASLPTSVPLNNIQDFDNYIALLRQIPQAFEGQLSLLAQGERDGLTPPRVLLEQIPAQCKTIISTNPFIEPTKHFPDGIANSDQRRITREIQSVVQEQVLPEYQRFTDFVERQYLPSSRISISEDALPTGAERYQNEIHRQTTTNLSAAQIHSIGLAEIKRINGQLSDVAHRAGYSDLNSYRSALKSDPKYKPASPEAIVDDFERYVEQMRPKLPLLFNVVPHSRLVVKALSQNDRPNITHHVDGSDDGATPGQILVAVSDFNHRSLISDETIAYHEGIPGHELQVTIQQRLRDIPEFQRKLRNNAYVEGWAVYAEALGKQVGFFQEPASDYGRLNTELMRAVRMVADTGVHSLGWTREQGADFYRGCDCVDEPTIQAEMDRITWWPGQGLSYKIGQLKLKELRDESATRLQTRFDIRSFHDQVLDSGSLPLDILAGKIERWVQRTISEEQPAKS